MNGLARKLALVLALLAMVTTVAQARFVSADPVQADPNNGQSFNRYYYANNNPYRFTDPDGRRSKEEHEHKQEIAQARQERELQEHRQTIASKEALAPVVPEAIIIPALRLAKGLATAGEVAASAPQGAGGLSNPVPSTLARVIPDGIPANSLGAPRATDVFVTAADDIAGMTASQIANRLTIPNSATGFRVIELATPQSGVASPVFRLNPGFVGGGRTAGGAREFVVPNGPIPAGATTRVVGP